MLVLARKLGESIHIGNDVVVRVVQIRPGRIRLGIEAPRSVQIRRQECRVVDADDAEDELELDIASASAAGVC